MAAIDRVKMEMDILAALLVQETGEVDEVESPAFDGMDDDAFLRVWSRLSSTFCSQL